MKYITELPEGRKQTLTFLLFVVLSAGIWTVNALNQTHTVKTRIAIRPHNGMTGKSPGPDDIEIELRGRGFDLLPVLSAAKSYTLVPPGNEPVWNIRQSVNAWLFRQGKSIELTSVQPSTITLDLSSRYTRRLPVLPVLDIRSGSGWVQSGPEGIWPDSITLVADQPFPDSLRQVRTAPTRLNLTSGSHFGSIALSIPPGTEPAGDSRVWVYVPAERATEARVKVRINSLRVGYLTIPGSAEVTCRVPLSRHSTTTADRFIVIAEPDPADPERALLKVLHAPYWCSNIITQPASVKMFRTTTPAS